MYAFSFIRHRLSVAAPGAATARQRDGAAGSPSRKGTAVAPVAAPLRLLAAATLAFAATGAWAQTYPDRPVRVVVPFPAASATDVLARTIGQKLSEKW